MSRERSTIDWTLAREDARWILETAENAVAMASAHRTPRLLAHRADAERRYHEAVARRDRLYTVAMDAIGERNEA